MTKQLITYFIAIIISTQFLSCVEPIHPYSAVAPGVWRGVLFIDPNLSVRPDFKEVKNNMHNLDETNLTGKLPFLFDVVYTDDTTWHIEFINGEERITVEDITFGRNKASANQVLRVNFIEYDSELNVVVKEDIMQGHFIVRSKKDYRIPFAAYHAQDNRFIRSAKTKTNSSFDGKWEVTFDPGTEDAYPAIGEFNQDGNKLTGTFLTETGDYRYLEGVVDGHKMWMSVFDGAHAFLFHAKQEQDGSLLGIFRSGKHYQSTWTAIRNPQAKLTHPDSLSKATLPTFSIEFPDENGKMTTVPSSDEVVKIIQILGTWCPNCKDESQYLSQFLNEHPEFNVQVTGLAFERYDENKKAQLAIKKYRNKLGIPYPILHAGPANKTTASEILPMIDRVISFPTMVILDKNNKIRKVHTGFSGPATSVFKSFNSEFKKLITELSNE